MTHELFASPLNCAFPSYCSVFPDTDSVFGSRGGFFQFCRGPLRASGGSCECNPPFDEHMIARTVSALLGALASSEQPLSVALIVPDWPDSDAIGTALRADCCRAQLFITGDRHAYLSGRQHSCQSRHKLDVAATGRGSRVIFLQNDAGASRWPTTECRLERLKQAWGAL